MKKIGIITLYKSDNPGAVLQAYALQQFIKQEGYNAEIIQYTDTKKREQKMNPVKRMLHRFWYTTLKRKLLKDRKWIRVQNFIQQNDSLSVQTYNSNAEIKKHPPIYDIYITGSDQLWNDSITGADDAYFLSFAPDNAVKISYGTSSGSIKEILKNKAEKTALLSRYDAIAVRETDLVSTLKSEFGIKAESVLDPTLLMRPDSWKMIADQSLITREDDYILCYIMPGDRLVETGIEQIAEELARQTGYHIVRVGLKDKDRLRCRKNDIFDAGPAEFVRLIADAKCVITNSFHGSVFSINFGKNVYGVINGEVDGRKTRASRLISIFELLGMDNRLVFFSEKDEGWKSHVTENQYDYENAHLKLEAEREKSTSYLIKWLEFQKTNE